MTVTEAINKTKELISSDVSGVTVVEDIYSASLEKKLPFITIDVDETEIKNGGGKIPYGIAIKFTVLCAVKAKNKNMSIYRSEAEGLARNVVGAFQNHKGEIVVASKGFSFQEFLIGSTEVSAVGVECETYIRYE